ncbi:hypothetical protein CPB84DRAFT_1857350 [Gymnopilus junonius]|uniref:DNA 3'-5' helicase n=1 Tax=Gymnopilus junonius TaxID=109634 RepID=A0A9P5N759_GYMJU|nr:hypothetical protein CPB84DRAFT_1857350 [Gymnopilus junonius]
MHPSQTASSSRIPPTPPSDDGLSGPSKTSDRRAVVEGTDSESISDFTDARSLARSRQGSRGAIIWRVIGRIGGSISTANGTRGKHPKTRKREEQESAVVTYEDGVKLTLRRVDMQVSCPRCSASYKDIGSAIRHVHKDRCASNSTSTSINTSVSASNSSKAATHSTSTSTSINTGISTSTSTISKAATHSTSTSISTGASTSSKAATHSTSTSINTSISTSTSSKAATHNTNTSTSASATGAVARSIHVPPSSSPAEAARRRQNLSRRSSTQTPSGTPRPFLLPPTPRPQVMTPSFNSNASAGSSLRPQPSSRPAGAPKHTPPSRPSPLGTPAAPQTAVVPKPTSRRAVAPQLVPPPRTIVFSSRIPAPDSDALPSSDGDDMDQPEHIKADIDEDMITDIEATEFERCQPPPFNPSDYICLPDASTITAHKAVNLQALGLVVNKTFKIVICLHCHRAPDIETIVAHVKEHLPKPIAIPANLSELLITTFGVVPLRLVRYFSSPIPPVFGVNVYRDPYVFCKTCNRGYANLSILRGHQSNAGRCHNPRKERRYYMSYAQSLTFTSHHRYFPVDITRLQRRTEAQPDYVAVFTVTHPPAVDFSALPLQDVEDELNLNQFMFREGWNSYTRDKLASDIIESSRAALKEETWGFASLKAATRYLGKIQGLINQHYSFGLLTQIGDICPMKESHFQFNHLQPGSVEKYARTLHRLVFNVLRSLRPDWNNPVTYPPLGTPQREKFDALFTALQGEDIAAIDQAFELVCYTLFALYRYQYPETKPLHRWFSTVNSFLVYSSFMPDGSIMPASRITQTIAYLMYADRSAMFIKTLQISDQENISTFEAFKRVQSYLQDRQETPMAYLYNTCCLLATVRSEEVSPPSFTFTDAFGRQVSYKGDLISLDAVKRMHDGELVGFWNYVQENLFFGEEIPPELVPQYEMEKLVDNLSNMSPGYSFIDDLRNPFQKYCTAYGNWLFSRPARAEKYGFVHDGKIALISDACMGWLEHAEHARNIALPQASTSAGPTERATEFARAQYRNVTGSLRNLRILFHNLCRVSTQDKTSHTKMKDLNIPHPPTREWAHVLIFLLVVIRPFEDFIPMTADKYRELMGKVTKKYIGIGLTPKIWRSLVTYFCKYLTEPQAFELHKQYFVDSAMMHSSAMADAVSMDWQKHVNIGQDRPLKIAGITDDPLELATADLQPSLAELIPALVNKISRQVTINIGTALEDKVRETVLNSMAQVVANALPSTSQSSRPDAVSDIQVPPSRLSDLRRFLCRSDASFSCPEQAILLELMIRGEQSVLGILGTGTGKTTAVMLYAKMYSRGKTTLVVLPLSGLHADLDRRARSFGISISRWRRDGKYNSEAAIIYVSIEDVANDEFKPWFRDMEHGGRLAIIVFDEIHKVITDQDYREPFKKFWVLNLVNTIIVGLTGTLPPQLLPRFTELTKTHWRIIRTPSVRRELCYEIKRVGRSEMFDAIAQHASRLVAGYSSTQRCIIFCRTQSIACQIATTLHLDAYTADVDPDIRAKIMEAWISGRNKVMVSTSILGCGLDIKGIRNVIHVDVAYNMLDQHQQESRGGRDGLPCTVTTYVPQTEILFHLPRPRWLVICSSFISSSYPESTPAIAARPSGLEKRKNDDDTEFSRGKRSRVDTSSPSLPDDLETRVVSRKLPNGTTTQFMHMVSRSSSGASFTKTHPSHRPSLASDHTRTPNPPVTSHRPPISSSSDRPPIFHPSVPVAPPGPSTHQLIVEPIHEAFKALEGHCILCLLNSKPLWTTHKNDSCPDRVGVAMHDGAYTNFRRYMQNNMPTGWCWSCVCPKADFRHKVFRGSRCVDEGHLLVLGYVYATNDQHAFDGYPYPPENVEEIRELAKKEVDEGVEAGEAVRASRLEERKKVPLGSSLSHFRIESLETEVWDPKQTVFAFTLLEKKPDRGPIPQPIPSTSEAGPSHRNIINVDSDDERPYLSRLYGYSSDAEASEKSSLREDEFETFVGTRQPLYEQLNQPRQPEDLVRGNRLAAIERVKWNELVTRANAHDTLPVATWSRGFTTPVPNKTRPHVLTMLDAIRNTTFLPFEASQIEGVQRLDEDVLHPIAFAAQIQDLLSNQTTVIVACSNTPKIFFDMEYIQGQFAIHPDQLVNVSKCDSHSTTNLFAVPIRLYFLSEHLDHGYLYGWGSFIVGQGNQPDWPYAAERLHSSLQCYPATFFRPYHWREMVPGCSVAIQTRSGILILRVFRPPDSTNISERLTLLEAFTAMEDTKDTCLVIELLPGEMIILPPGVLFDIYSPVPTIATTTYFLNYHTFHLTEMARTRMKFKSDRNMDRQQVSQVLQATMIRMLAALPRLNIAPLPIKTLLALSKLVLSPAHYISSKLMSDMIDTQEEINSMIESNSLDASEQATFHFHAHEIAAFKIAKRVIDSADAIGVAVPIVTQEDDKLVLDLDSRLHDYLFFNGRGEGTTVSWSLPGRPLNDCMWTKLVYGLVM